MPVELMVATEPTCKEPTEAAFVHVIEPTVAAPEPVVIDANDAAPEELIEAAPPFIDRFPVHAREVTVVAEKEATPRAVTVAPPDPKLVVPSTNIEFEQVMEATIAPFPTFKALNVAMPLALIVAAIPTANDPTVAPPTQFSEPTAALPVQVSEATVAAAVMLRDPKVADALELIVPDSEIDEIVID